MSTQHAQGMLLFLVLAVNSARFRISRSYSSRPYVLVHMLLINFKPQKMIAKVEHGIIKTALYSKYIVLIFVLICFDQAKFFLHWEI